MIRRDIFQISLESSVSKDVGEHLHIVRTIKSRNSLFITCMSYAIYYKCGIAASKSLV